MLFQDHIPLVWFCRVVEIASGVGVNMIFLLFDVNNLLNRFARLISFSRYEHPIKCSMRNNYKIY